MGLTRAGLRRRIVLTLGLLLVAVAAVAAPRAPAPAPAAAPAPAPCPRCPDTLLASDGTPGVALTGTLSRVDGRVVLDGCAGRVTLEDVLGESVGPLIGRDAWVNAVCTGSGRVAALGGHALGDSVVDLFVMSLCPFGRALERQIAADLARADSVRRPPVRVHWILYDQMTDAGQTMFSKHGNEELREDVVQMAIRELEPDRFWPYLLERSTTDTTWTALAGRVGLGWRTLTEIQRRLANELQDRAHAEWLATALDWPHIEGSPTVFWMGREVKDIALVPGFSRAKMPTEQCKN
jgi:hypothetical protein